MAIRPFAFGLRLRDKGRTVRIETREAGSGRYRVEERRPGARPRRRDHDSLGAAVKDAARSWRSRLH